MKTYYRMLLLLVAALLFAACTSGPRPVHQVVYPTIGPVHRVSGSSGISRIELTASTNCAEVGELITFTVQISNELHVPITISDTPALDLVLKSAGPEAPIQRWSSTPYYPKTIKYMIDPGETLTYQWPWIADASYAQLEQTTSNGVIVQLVAGEIIIEGHASRPIGDMEVYVGVGAHVLPQPTTSVRCSEMHN